MNLRDPVFGKVEFAGLDNGLDVTAKGGIRDDCRVSDLKEQMNAH